jgi:hypothetical protein
VVTKKSRLSGSGCRFAVDRLPIAGAVNLDARQKKGAQ